MNYYKRHLGDYARDAGHLSMLEHGAFTLLLDRYYAAERPLERDEAIRVCRAKSKDEVAAVEYVLRSFFTEEPAGFRNKRADSEIEKANTKAERNREVGNLGGRPKASGNEKETMMVPETNHDGSESKPSDNPSHNSTTPLRKKRTPVVPASGDVVTVTLAAYHEALPLCRHHYTVTPRLAKRILVVNGMAAKLIREMGWDLDVAGFWSAYFGECANNAWLRGEQKNPNDPKWKQHIACLIHDDRFQTIMDGAIERMRAELPEAA